MLGATSRVQGKVTSETVFFPDQIKTMSMLIVEH